MTPFSHLLELLGAIPDPAEPAPEFRTAGDEGVPLLIVTGRRSRT